MDTIVNNTAIVAQVEANPTLVLVDEKKFEDFYEHVKAEASSMNVDLATDKGRKAIASMAHKIARTKTAIDDAGKKLNEEARAKINVVDEARRKIRERFDTLKEEVRRPLTEWEKSEVERVGKVDRFFNRMTEFSKVSLDDTADAIKGRYESLTLVRISEDVFQDRHADAVAAQDRTLSVLKVAFERLTREEAERAELARLRQEQEERAAEEARRRHEEEQRLRAIEEVKQAEEARQREDARRKAERERIEREARERAEAEAKARVEAAERAAREAEESAVRKIEEERQAREREKAEQERVEREAREVEAARQSDRDHRAKIMGAAKEAIIETGIDEAKAKELVLAIAAGNIPNVSIRF